MIHKIYEDEGKYDIIYYLPKIFISFIASHVINIILNYIFLSERDIEKLRKLTYEKANNLSNNIERRLICKYSLFFIFLFFFWVLLSSFGAVYQNTQIFVVENTLISFGIELIYPFFFDFFPCLFRIISLNSKSSYLYNFNKFLQFL